MKNTLKQIKEDTKRTHVFLFDHTIKETLIARFGKPSKYYNMYGLPYTEEELMDHEITFLMSNRRYPTVSGYMSLETTNKKQTLDKIDSIKNHDLIRGNRHVTIELFNGDVYKAKITMQGYHQSVLNTLIETLIQKI